LSKLRDLARGKLCQIRVPGICDGNPETTVLAHYRLSGLSGMGIKAPDWAGAYSCARCHSMVDSGRSANFTRAELKQMHLEGVLRTLAMLEHDGVKLW